MSNIAMLEKPKSNLADIKRRLDNIFGSFNTFTEMLRSSSGLASSIYGVPLSSTSFDALNEMNSLSNSYSVNTYASTSHTELTLPKHNVNFGSLSNNDYSTTNILRPPTKEVLQSMQDLVKDDLLKNIDFSTDICAADDNLTPSTSKMSEKVSKCLTPLTSTITNRKRDSHFNTEFKFLDSKIKRFKKEEKNNSPKNFSQNNIKTLNRDVQLELFGGFSDEENYCKAKEKNLKANFSSLASTTASLLAPQHQISPPPQPPVLTLLKLEKDKDVSKTLTKTDDKHSLLPHKENCVIKNNDSNSPRIVIRISCPSATVTSSSQSFDTVDNYADIKDINEKKKYKENKFKKTEKEIKSPLYNEKNKTERISSLKTYSKSSKINESIKNTTVIKPNACCTASPESNDIHSPDSGFVDMVSNGTSFGLSSAAVLNKSNTDCVSYDTKADLETIMEQFGHVSPLLSPLKSLSPLLIESCNSIMSPAKYNVKVKSPNNMLYDVTKKEKTNKNQNLFLSCNNKSAPNDFQQTKNIQKSAIILSKPSCSFNDGFENSSRDFPCQIKINSSLAKLFAFKSKEKLTEKKANNYSVKLESIDDNLVKKTDSFESKFLEKQAIFDQRIKIKEEIIQSHEILIAEQRTQLKNFEKITKMHEKEIETRDKKILLHKNENKELLKKNVLLTGKTDRLTREVERLSIELDALKKRHNQYRN